MVACVLSLLGATARGDERAVKSNRGMMITGIVLTAVGATLTMPGAVMIGAGTSCMTQDSYSCGEQGAGVFGLTGALLVAMGGSLVVTGVPLWIVGQVRLKRARLAISPTALNASF